jgi:hypothetical protein
MQFVDLAGSERISVMSTGNTKKSTNETININKSLMTLRKVITALASQTKQIDENSTKHVPFRESKLTQILK